MEATPIGSRTTPADDPLEHAAKRLASRQAEITGVSMPDKVELSTDAIALMISRTSMSATIAVIDNETGMTKIFNDVVG